MEIDIPYNFTPRPYQIPLFQAMDSGCKRAILLWARRHGKDKTAWNYLIKRMIQEVGNYAYIFPTASLARKASWQNIDSDGLKFLDHIPTDLIARKQDQSMHIELTNGSTVTFFGSDRQISVGTNYRGIILSEYALQDPECFAYLRPVLRENKGFLIVASTPRGKNHYFDMWEMAKKNPEWFCQKITYEDANVLTDDDIESERIEGVSDEMIESEYRCSFRRGVDGCYFGKLMDKLYFEERILSFSADPNLQVYTSWDIGMRDSTSIIFYQRTHQSIRILDCYENSGEGFQHYANVLRRKAEENEWVYGVPYGPHDLEVRELTANGLTRREVARGLGINFHIVKNIPLIDGIEQARALFHKLWINESKCEKLIKALENYQKTFNEKTGVYSDRPLHNWASHFADSFRYLAIAEKSHAMSGDGLSIEEWSKVRKKHIV
jgi:hypothetical protein